MRKVNKTLKKRNIKKYRYLGGTKYADDENFRNAHRQIFYSDPVDNTIFWLEKAKKDYPNDKDIQKLIDKLNKSKKLLNEVRDDIEKLVDDE